MTNDILSVIRSRRPGFSKGQKRIADYILTSYDKAAFMTASRLGKTANVSESTVCALPPNWAMTVIPPCRRPFRR